MHQSHLDIRNLAVRSCALFLGIWLMLMPQVANSSQVLQIMEDCGSVPAPMAEEEEVKHACSLSWCTVYEATDDHLLQGRSAPSMQDPYSLVEHHEVDIPPPK
jgi:hypothetical protein